MHGGLLMLAGSRMAKSAGNFFRVTELEEKGLDPLAFRYLALQAKYRTKLNFSLAGLGGADRALRLLRERVAEWSGRPAEGQGSASETLDSRFRAALADDLDLPTTMALVSELTRSTVVPDAEKAALLKSWDRVLGLDLDRVETSTLLSDSARELLDARAQARTGRDFATSDRLREELAGLGVEVTDTPDGQRWRTK